MDLQHQILGVYLYTSAKARIDRADRTTVVNRTMPAGLFCYVREDEP